MMHFKIGPKLRQYITVIMADFTFLHLGMHVAWLSPLQIQLKDANQTVLPQMISDDQVAWLISISSLIATISFFCNGYLADHLGRKYTIILGSILRLISCLMFLIVSDVWMLMFARALSGIADAICCSVTTFYASEIASKEIRGELGAICQIMSGLGSMLILSIGPFLNYMTLTTIITCITVVTFIPLLFLPESPYLLYAKGRVKESTAVLSLLRKEDSVEEELSEYSLSLSTDVKINKLTLLKDCIVLKSFGMVTVLAIGSQMTGFNAVLFYLQSIFESTHTTVRPEISSVVIGCIQLLACCVTFAITDKFGRKPLLTSSLIGLTVGMVGLGTFFTLRDMHYEIFGFLNYLPLVSIMLVIFCYDAGLGATVWTLCAELFDGPSRAMGVTFAVFLGTASIFLTTRYFGFLAVALGPAQIYWIFGACCTATCLFIIFCIPETKGKAFSEIQKEMGRNIALKEKGTIENQIVINKIP